MKKRISYYQSLGVLCVAGGFASKKEAEEEKRRAYEFSESLYTRFHFAEIAVVDKPTGLLTSKEYEYRNLLVQGVREVVSKGGYEKVAFFGSFLTDFMREMVSEAMVTKPAKSVVFYASSGSQLEAYGKWFSRSGKPETWYAYFKSEAMGLKTPG